MDTVVSYFTVFFEGPFWVGVFEREYCGKYEACKITFGSEPKDYEIFEFLLKNYCNLRFSPSVETEISRSITVNPKRIQREISRQMQKISVGTKAQQVLKLQHEQSKLERKKHFKKKLIEEKERQFALKQEKRKRKHRGH